MAARLAAVIAFAIVTLALVIAAQSTPTILVVVVEVQAGSAKVLSATAVRGEIRENQPEPIDGITAGSDDWVIEYIHKTTGGAGRVLQTGLLHVSLVPIIDEPRYDKQRGAVLSLEPAKKRVVMFAVADVTGATDISFARLTPVAGVPMDKWPRVPLGQSPLPPVRREALR